MRTALLITACGCKKQVLVAGTPPETIQLSMCVPLRGKGVSGDDSIDFEEGALLQQHTRTFEVHEDHDTALVLTYRERVELPEKPKRPPRCTKHKKYFARAEPRRRCAACWRMWVFTHA